jgi:hypothetical protein
VIPHFLKIVDVRCDLKCVERKVFLKVFCNLRGCGWRLWCWWSCGLSCESGERISEMEQREVGG